MNRLRSAVFMSALSCLVGINVTSAHAVPIGSGYSCTGNKIFLQGSEVKDYKERKQNFATAIKSAKAQVAALKKKKPQTKDVKKKVAAASKLLAALQTVQAGMSLCKANAAPALVFKQLLGSYSGHYFVTINSSIPFQGNWSLSTFPSVQDADLTTVRVTMDELFNSLTGSLGIQTFEFSFDPRTIPLGGSTMVVHPTVGTIYVGMANDLSLSLYFANLNQLGLVANFSLGFDKKYSKIDGFLEVLIGGFPYLGGQVVLGKD